MMGLTPVQARALGAIRTLTREGVSPSYSEIREALDLGSNSGVHRVLSCLRDRGLIDFIPHRARSIRIVGELEGLDRRSSDDLRALRDRIDLVLKGRAS